MIPFKCPICKQICEAPDEFKGGSATCDQCGTRIAIPAYDHLIELQRQVSISGYRPKLQPKVSSAAKNDLTWMIFSVIMAFAIGFFAGAAID